MSGALLNVHALERSGTRALGPGLRYALWLQGCPFDCPGCATPEARPVESRLICPVADVAADIVASRCEGLTVSGGEPFLQVEGMLELLTEIRAVRPEMTVIVFTGFLLENLTGREAREALGLIDLLVDGPYVRARNDGVGLRGSSNQRLHFLTSRLLPWREELEGGKRSVEIRFRGDGVIESVGIPLKGC